jgi:hypothetical protein
MSEKDLSISHPQISSLYKLYLLETQPFRKVHRMIDLFETIIKMHTVVILSEYVAHNNLSDVAKGLLAQGLRTPSLGTWQLFSRVLFTELQLSSYQWMLDELPIDFVLSDNELSSGLLKAKLEFPQFNKEVLIQLKADKKNRQSNFDDVIALRNSYAHGATPSDEKCAEDIQKFEPFLMQLLALNWLHQSYLEVEDNKVILNYKQQKLSLHPLLLYRNEQTQASFAFFNDLKNDKIGLLNYPLGKHYREKEFLNEFHQYLPLHDWKKTGANEFQQRIEELTETFKGRTAERNQLLNFVVEKQKGYCSIQGNPGIGKSALIAQFFKDLRLHESCKDIQVIEYFIRRGTQQAKPEVLLEYLIKKTDELFPKAREIRAEGKMVFDLQNQLFAKWRLWAEHCNGTKLLFLIDGLDEGVEENITQYLPKENFQNMLFIYGSRPGGHKSIDELWGNLPIEHHLKIELSGLGKEDIRAMIYEVANKYEIEKDSAWIEAIQQRSQGNPLYLKLLCDAIANKSIGLNDINALPKEIDEYYKAILFRYAQDSVDGDALLDSLYTFAAAKDYLSFAHIGLINKLGEAKLQRIGSTLKEVLIENPLTEDVLDYQLFHESFREYLFKEKSFKITEANEQIIDYCASWKELEGTWEQRYALEFYAVHLSESKKTINHETLLKLIDDKAYLSAQKKVLRHFKASNKLMQLAIEKSAELKNQDTLLEAALCLVDLKYEEDNDAPRILEMIANGEIDFALQRIEAFGTNDKEGLKRKFILYMLCLMELTLLESKEKPFRKEAIEKLLKHLDVNIPVDHSVLNWNDFFSSYLIFQMACEWAELGLDYLTVYKRTDNWEKNWISEKGPYFQKQIDVLINAAREINNGSKLISILLIVASEFYKHGKLEKSLILIEEAKNRARKLIDEEDRSQTLIKIATELVKQGKVEDTLKLKEESLNIAFNISSQQQKSLTLSLISSELAKQGLIKESINLALSLLDNWDKSNALIKILKVLAKKGLFKESFELVEYIYDKRDRNKALGIISKELIVHGNIEKSLSVAREMSEILEKSLALTVIASELDNQGFKELSLKVFDESIHIASDISTAYEKGFALKSIATEKAKQGKIDESVSIAEEILDNRFKISTLRLIAIEVAKQGKILDSLNIVYDIGVAHEKYFTLIKIASELAKLGNTGNSFNFIEELLKKTNQGISFDSKCKLLVKIVSELVRQQKIEESLVLSLNISDKNTMIEGLKLIVIELAKQGMIEESLSITSEIRGELGKIQLLIAIANELAIQGNFKEFSKFMEESISKAYKIINEFDKFKALKIIVSELAKYGKIEESLLIAREISVDMEKNIALREISSELAKQGMIEESLNIAQEISDEFFDKFKALEIIVSELAKYGKIEESLRIAREMSDNMEKNIALREISSELAKQGMLSDSIIIAQEISEVYDKSSAYIIISTELAKLGETKTSSCFFKKSLSAVQGISNNFLKSKKLAEITIELVKQGKWITAEEVGYEISLMAERYSCWMEIARNTIERHGWTYAVKYYVQFQSEEAKLFYLKGIVKHINIIDVTDDCIEVLIPMLSNDTYSIEILMQKYSIKKLILEKVSVKEEERLNRTLNLQWVLDITSKFEKEFEKASHNVQEWINEIEDENDREDVLSWAEKVEQGKMTEQKFLERVNKL